MSFGDVRKALDAYAAYLDSIGCLSPRRLRPGLSEAQAQEAAHGLGLTLPEDALAIWTWHDGEGAAADFPALCLGGRGGFFNTLRFPSLKVAFRVAEYAASYCGCLDGGPAVVDARGHRQGFRLVCRSGRAWRAGTLMGCAVHGGSRTPGVHGGL